MGFVKDSSISRFRGQDCFHLPRMKSYQERNPSRKFYEIWQKMFRQDIRNCQPSILSCFRLVTYLYLFNTCER
ncbi:unnamed protein product [Larinioides sclopetarius]|uniref:Uncharacterized protein n=1 Tax=Larinioides sclopetarius TaxID=280406 RepID=A0AAV2BV80_9ARAC